MEKNIKSGLKVLILLFCILLASSYCFAQDLDISISNITFPGKIYLYQKVTIYIELLNNSGTDLRDCTLTVEAGDGSKTSQLFPLSKDGLTAELKWVPQHQGKIQFKVTLIPPEGVQEENKENNQFTKIIEILPR